MREGAHEAPKRGSGRRAFKVFRVRDGTSPAYAARLLDPVGQCSQRLQYALTKDKN